jgi:hypothetical protein
MLINMLSCRWILNHFHIFVSNLDGDGSKTNVSSEIDTNYTTKFMINNVDILSPWNQYKIHCQNHLSRGSSTVETETAKLL